MKNENNEIKRVIYVIIPLTIWRIFYFTEIHFLYIEKRLTGQRPREATVSESV